MSTAPKEDLTALVALSRHFGSAPEYVLAGSRRGEEAVRELLGAEVLWIPTVNPGFQLASTVRREMESFSRRHGRSPNLLVLQNHGLCVAGRGFAEVRRQSEELLAQ